VAAGQAVAKPTPNRITLRGSLTPAVERAHPAGKVSASSRVRFDLLLTMRNAAGARTFVRQVSSPGSRLFHKFLTRQQWIARYGPTNASIASARSWLHSQGFAVGSVPKTHLYVSASGTAAQVERAFGVTLGYYMVNGHRVRLANGTLSIPAGISGSVAGVVGVNQFIARNDLAVQGRSPAAAPAAAEPPPPAGFRNPQPCTSSFNSRVDTADSKKLYSPPFANKRLDYDICGYVPSQIRSAYGIAGAVSKGDNGSGVGVAIVDAYDSPTLLSDSQRYFTQNDPANPLSAGQFFNDEPATTSNIDVCGGPGWRAEQSLDVQAVHGMAPGAAILYVGAASCFDADLLAAENVAISSGASAVTNSWGSLAGDLFVDAATKTAYDNTFLVADATGVSVMFSSGDAGDNFATIGIAAPDFPSIDPFVTSVGGTTLEINAKGNRAAELGWSVAKLPMCIGVMNHRHCPGTTAAGPLAFQAGGGGGTSFTYTQPFYQAGVVPAALALRNEALFGPVPLRVAPDIAMDADAQSGMLIGLRQTFPEGVHYGQFKEGGTSLASPLFAGVIADADQAAGNTLGFLNPELYDVAAKIIAGKAPAATFNDIVPPSDPASSAVIRVDFTNTVNSANGFNVSARAIDYEGPETFCDGTGNCETRNVTLNTAPGFDSITGIGSVGPQFLQIMSLF
ncbi:MAG TPA: S53 family peptidase, partial [Streptosporangiaceae bacterium]|nr:S53 family peptidase [Streptosporangiaceae bacterium]